MLESFLPPASLRVPDLSKLLPYRFSPNPPVSLSSIFPPEVSTWWYSEGPWRQAYDPNGRYRPYKLAIAVWRGQHHAIGWSWDHAVPRKQQHDHSKQTTAFVLSIAPLDPSKSIPFIYGPERRRLTVTSICFTVQRGVTSAQLQQQQPHSGQQRYLFGGCPWRKMVQVTQSNFLEVRYIVGVEIPSLCCRFGWSWWLCSTATIGGLCQGGYTI